MCSPEPASSSPYAGPACGARLMRVWRKVLDIPLLHGARRCPPGSRVCSAERDGAWSGATGGPGSDLECRQDCSASPSSS